MLRKIKTSMKRINYRLYAALLLLGLCPTVYTTVTSPETMEENMKKKLLSIVLAICLLLSLVPMPAMAEGETNPAVPAAGENCTGDHTNWTEFVEPASGNLATGNYYLTGDVVLKYELIITGTVNLCLNGHDLLTDCAGSMISVKSNATLNLYDCNTARVRYGWWKYETDKWKYIVETKRPVGVDCDVLTGGMITGACIGDIVQISVGGTLTMNGGNIVGGTANCRGVHNCKGTFTMNGGSIIGNATADNGGGVYNDRSTATFTMNGGIIGSNRSAYSGGGVYNYMGTFNMNGGSITGNTATGENSNGGGVYNEGSSGNPGTFNMTGGSITGNTATGENSNGGGVYNEGSPGNFSTFNMNGGSITGNTAKIGGGVYNSGIFTMKGSPVIMRNTNKDGTASDVYLNNKISLTDQLTDGAAIGVTAVKGSIAEGAKGENDENVYTPTAADAKYFLSHDATMKAECQDNKICLVEATALTKEGGPLAAGTYYLDSDLSGENKLTSNLVISGTVTLNLNGHVLTGTGNGPVITVNSGAVLNLLDSGSTARYGRWTDDGNYIVETERPDGVDCDVLTGGMITGGNANEKYAGGGGILIRSDNEPGNSKGALRMYGGNIVGNTASDSPTGGGGVHNAGIFDMYGGAISGNTAVYSGAISGNRPTGGGVRNAGEFTMCGGTIADNHADKGGGIYSGNTFNMTGGTISGNTAKMGGGVYNDRLFVLSGGSITGNNAPTGGGVYSDAADVSNADICFKMTEGVISHNTATSGGGVYNGDADAQDEVLGKFLFTGGIITGNKATDDAANENQGSGGGVYNAGAFELASIGVIEKNEATGGGGVYNASFVPNDKRINCEITMNGGSITGNKAVNGGGVYNSFGGKFVMLGGAISDNTAKFGGGGVYNTSGALDKSSPGGQLIMSGGSITGNTADDGGGVYNGNVFELSHHAKISGNTKKSGTKSAPGNVFLDTNTHLSLTDYLENDAAIGVAVRDAASPVIDIVAGGGTYKITPDDAAKFTPDNPGLGLRLVSGENRIKLGMKYTVSFDFSGKGQNPPAEQTVVHGGPAAQPEAPAPVTGYTFGGWYTDAGCTGDAWDFTSDTVTGPTTLHAKWTPTEYAIDYSGIEGAAIDPANPAAYNIESGEIKLTNPTKTGYTFTGWSIGTDTALHDTITIPAASTGGKAYTAHWSANKYTVSFDKNGGTGDMANQEFTYDEAQNLTGGSFSKTGYTFAGWGTTENGSDIAYTDKKEISNLSDQSDGKVTLYARWTPNNFKVHFNANGGTGDKMADQDFVYDTAQNLTANSYTKTGYTFAGWSTTADGGKAYADKASVENLTDVNNGTVEIFARWTPVEYKITYDLGGGKFADETIIPTEYTIESDPITLISPVKAGYTFAGWTWDGQTEPQMEVTIAKGSTGEKAYTANWTAVEYTITYDLGGGSLEPGETNPDKYTVETPDYVLRNPVRTGYTFDGWTEEGKTGTQKNVTIAKGSTGNKKFTANWTAVEYTITYDLNGGEMKAGEINPEKYTIETPDYVLRNPVRTGYTFTGWTWDGQTEAKTEVTITKGSMGSEAYTANWTANTYKVTFDANGGKGDKMADQSFTYDAAKQALTENTYTRDHHTFDGWNLKADGTGRAFANRENVQNIAPGGTVTLYAQWKGDTSNVESSVNTGTPQVTEPAVKPGTPQAEKNAMQKAAEALKAPGAVQETGLSKVVSVKKNPGGDFIIEIGAKVSPVIDAETVSRVMEANHLTDASVVAEPSLRVQVTGAKTDSASGITSLTLDIKPLVNVKLRSGSFSKTLATPAIEHVGRKVTITLTLPDGFTVPEGHKIQVKHVKADGTAYYYDVQRDGNQITFVNPHGFSEFTVQTVAVSAKTGDGSHMALWSGLGMAAACGAAYVALTQRKKKEQDQ